jgi:hypothetical protein
LVIRQDRGRDNDSLIFIHPNNFRMFLEKLTEVCRLQEVP